MLKIGITGGIGSGKTYFAELLEKMFVPVYYADNEAKRLMNENENLKNELIEKISSECYSNGSINRDYLAKTIFGNETSLKTMNVIISKYIRSDFYDWCIERNNKHFVCFESANLIETKFYEKLDYIIHIKADMDIRIKRIKERDPFRTDVEIDNIIKKQLSDKERGKFTDIDVFNNGQDLQKEALDIKNILVKRNYNMVNGITTISINNDRARNLLKNMLDRNGRI